MRPTSPPGTPEPRLEESRKVWPVGQDNAHIESVDDESSHDSVNVKKFALKKRMM